MFDDVRDSLKGFNFRSAFHALRHHSEYETDTDVRAAASECFRWLPFDHHSSTLRESMQDAADRVCALLDAYEAKVAA